MGAVGARQEDGSLYLDVHPEGAGRQHRTKVSPFAAAYLTAWLQERKEFGLQGDVLFPAKPIGGMLQTTTVYRHVAALLTEAGIDHTYLEFGSYFSQWRRRNALKMWTGWPTFPMVFHNGVLLGGHKDTKALLAQGALKSNS